MNTEVASLLERYLKEATVLADMEKLAKSYPRIDNVDNMKAPRLEEEVYQAVEQRVRNTDMALQGIQRGVLAAMSAFAPVLDLTCARARSKEDKELDALGNDMMNGLKLLAHVHNALSSKRREFLKPQLDPAYAKALSKTQDSPTQEWLYGGDLEEKTDNVRLLRSWEIRWCRRRSISRSQGLQARRNTDRISLSLTQARPCG